MISNKHISKITIILISAVLILCVLAMICSDLLSQITNASGYSLEYKDKLFDTSKIMSVNIIMDDDSFNEMLDNAIKEEYYKCDVVVNGTTFYSVGIRPKGNTSLSSIASDPNNNRYSFKLEFDKYVDGQTCFGLDKLVLNNNYADTTNMKEAIIYDMFSYLDADASLYNYAKISLNDNYWGTYLALEAVEESFMLRNFGTEKGHLYKPDNMARNNGKDDKNSSSEKDFPVGGNRQRFEGNFPQPPQDVPDAKPTSPDTTDEASPQSKEQSRQNGRFFGNKFPADMGGGGRGGMGMGGGSNLNYTDDNLDSYSSIWNASVNDSTDSDHKRVVEALKNISERNNIEKYIDVDNILKYMAVHNFSVNDDSLSGSMAHNYYLYEANGRINIIPWDYNLAFGGMRGGTGTDMVNTPIDDPYSSTRLFDFVLENEEYKKRYHEYYNKLVNKYLLGGGFKKAYNRIRNQIDNLVKSDPNSMYTYEAYTKAADIFYEAVMLRAESVEGQLTGTIPTTSEKQREDSSSLVDASHINTSDLGQFMGGGRNRNQEKSKLSQSE